MWIANYWFIDCIAVVIVIIKKKIISHFSINTVEENKKYIGIIFIFLILDILWIMQKLLLLVDLL